MGAVRGGCDAVFLALHGAMVAEHVDDGEGELLRRAEDLKIWREFGYASMLEYMEKAMGENPHTASERLRTARQLYDLPGLSKALAAGDIKQSAARELSRVALPESKGGGHVDEIRTSEMFGWREPAAVVRSARPVPAVLSTRGCQLRTCMLPNVRSDRTPRPTRSKGHATRCRTTRSGDATRLHGSSLRTEPTHLDPKLLGPPSAAGLSPVSAQTRHDP